MRVQRHAGVAGGMRSAEARAAMGAGHGIPMRSALSCACFHHAFPMRPVLVAAPSAPHPISSRTRSFLPTQGWGENDRGVSYTFGPDCVADFLQKHDLDLICRAHQVRSAPIKSAWPSSWGTNAYATAAHTVLFAHRLPPATFSRIF
jgi:hypothetical protein